MKLNSKYLLPLLFALSMVFASCDKSNPTDKNGYLYDEEMAIAMREPSDENNLPENYYYLSFYNSTGEKGVSVVLVGDDNETALQAGTYNSGNNLLIEDCSVIAGEKVYLFHKGNGTVTVTGDATNYSFDIELSDGKKKFHFTYSGAVEGISSQEPEQQH